MSERKAKLGLAMLSLAAEPLRDGIETAREAQRLGYSCLWLPEVSGPDALVALGALAMCTETIELATAFLTLNELSLGRAIAGLGVSSPVIVEQWHGASYRSPLTAMRECVAIMRQLFDEGRVKFEGAIYRAQLRLRMPITQARRPRIYLAALNPPMLRLAGEIADGVLLNYSPPEAVAEQVTVVRRAAQVHGRDPDELDYAVFARMCVSDDAQAARTAFKRELATYAFVEAYQKMFARIGLDQEMAEVRRLWQAGQRDQAPMALSDASADKLGSFGPADRARDFIARFRAAGITHPVVFPVGPTRTNRRDFLNTMRELASA
jgi:alkanesulfonate monooxygenase SsuD/methylene tetrahydromethanopterin reductase-like flavin-dependent oxidoreductase (luciferase family)